MLKDAKSSVLGKNSRTSPDFGKEHGKSNGKSNGKHIYLFPICLLICPRGAWSFRRSGGRLRLHGDSDARCFKGPRPGGLLDDLEILDDLLDDLINLL